MLVDPKLIIEIQFLSVEISKCSKICFENIRISGIWIFVSIHSTCRTYFFVEQKKYKIVTQHHAFHKQTMGMFENRCLEFDVLITFETWFNSQSLIKLNDILTICNAYKRKCTYNLVWSTSMYTEYRIFCTKQFGHEWWCAIIQSDWFIK